MSFRNKLKIKGKNVLFKWLLSYISVLLVPMIISGVIYKESIRTIENEINRSNQSLLMQIQKGVDSRLKEIDKLSMEIALNKRVKSFITVEDNTRPEERYKVFDIVEDLRVYKSSNNFIKDIYIYYKNSDTVLSIGDPKSSKEFYNILKPQSELSYEKWNDFFFSRYLNSFMPVYFKTYENKSEKAIAYVRSLTIGSSGQPDVVMFFLVDKSQLLDNVQNLPLAEESTILVADNKNQIIASTNKNEENDYLSYLEMADKQGMLREKIGDKNYNALYTSSEITSWKYLAITSENVFWQKAEYIRKIIYISIILSLLIGGLVSYFFLKKNYNPISNLLHLLKSRAGMSMNKNSDEYGLIQETITKVLDEKERIGHRLKQQKNVVRSNFLAKLLKGSLENDIPVNEILPTFDIKFDSDYFSVIVFYVEEFSEYFNEYSEMSTNDQFTLLKFIITNVVEELAGQKNNGYMTEINEMMACLINFKEENEEHRKEELMRVVHEAKQFLMDKYHINLTIAISNVHRTIAGVPVAYREALEAMEYKLVMGSGEIICYDQIPRGDSINTRRGYSYPLQVEQQMVNCIKSGDLEKSKTILEDVFNLNFSRPSSSIPMAKCLMFDLVSTMVKTIDEIGDTYEDSLLNNLISLDCLFGCETIKEMKSEMFNILEKVCDYINDKKKNVNHKLKADVIRIINENYQDTNLSLSTIAEKIGMTPSYLSKQFKEQSGEGVLEYISKTRVDKSKGLFAEQKYTINDIALKVGYGDTNTFIRTFKKYEGITPGKFRETK